MKAKLLISIAALTFIIALVSAVNAEEIVVNSPWVYPATEATPTMTEYYVVPLSAGVNNINLILWNHDHNYDFINGKFIIAIKTGLAQVTIDSINLAFDTQDLTGTTHPGNFPPGSIYPCPWKQYNVNGTLTEWQNENGWQGQGDPSGMYVNITLTVTGNPLNVLLHFMSWGYKDMPQGPDYTDTPYSHLTSTFYRPPNEVPEIPLGPVMATATMIIGFAAYAGIRKKKT